MLLFVDDRDPVTLVAQVTDTVNRSGSYTFAGVNFGEEFTNRTIVAVTFLLSTAGVVLDQTSVSIGGVGGTGADAGDGALSPVGTAGAGVWAAKPSGTSGNIVINFTSGTATVCEVYVFAVTDLLSAGYSDFTTEVRSSDPNYPISKTGTLDIPAAGFLFSGCARANSTSAITLTGVTKRYEKTVESVHRIAVGYDYRMASETNRVVGYSVASGAAVFGMTSMSFG